MIFRSKPIFALFITLCLFPAVALAQDEQCLAIILAALAASEQACSGTGSNQACFGSPALQAEPQDGSVPFTFAQPGDIVNTRDLQTLRSSPLNAGNYGISLLRVQNATLLVFGDVEIHNRVSAADAPPTVEVSPTGSINVRSGPSTEDAIIGSLDARQTVTANGRLGDNSWLRVALPDGTFGWLYAPLVTTTGDINTLDIMDTAGAPLDARFEPMQSFTFQSGVGDAPCAGVPESGILLQTPAEAASASLSINQVEIVLTGTAFLQAQSGGEMIVNGLEGVTRVSAAGVTQVMPAGSRVRIPIGGNRAASGAPLEPEPYDGAALQALPVGNLEREVVVAPALTPEQIRAAGIPTPGEWVTTYTVLTFDCVDGRSEVEERFRSNLLTLQVEREGAAVVLVGSHERDDPPFATVMLARRGAGYYTAEATLENTFGRQSQYQFTVYVLSPTRLEGVTVGMGGDCTTTGPFIAELVTAA